MRAPLRRVWRWPIPVLGLAMLTTGLTAIDAAAAGPALPGNQKLTKVTGEPVKGKPAPGPAESQTKAWKGAPKIAWPAAGSAEITLPSTPAAPATSLKSSSAGAFALPARDAGVAGQAVKAGKLPVSVASADLTKSPAAAQRSAAGMSAAADAAAAAPTDVKVKVDRHD
ncbi:hypothetical protein ACFXKW_37230, partial [Streptomyces sp. NPDC059193]